MSINPISVIHIDDDEILRMAWSLVAEENGYKVLSFSSPEEFDSLLPSCAKTTPVFIDHRFGDRPIGISYAKRLFAFGFENIWLSTAATAKDFSLETWLKGVCDKTFPVEILNQHFLKG